MLIQVHSSRVLNRFDPAIALGAAIDGGEPGSVEATFRPATVRAMRSAGLRSLAYRLRTELAVEAWHWNPEGRWSGRDEGYWTSRAQPGSPIRVSYGYRLPRRGNTFDQANDDGYSRLTDGDASTFWKSNPYLRDAPQWLLVQLPQPSAVDAVRVRWAEPHALRFRAEYWSGDDSPDVDGGQEGAWRPFPLGEQAGKGGEETVRLGAVAKVRWLRLRLLASSHTPRSAGDWRDAQGFAIREIEVGRLIGNRLFDVLRHRKDHGQSPTWASSTDPWHRATDRDPNLEQPGLDLVFRSGLTNGLPVLMPAGVLYDTPENMAALLRWLRARRDPVRGFEMGEEPDGQVCAPEDYAVLFLRTAAALRAVDPSVKLGGPGYQTIESDYADWALQPLSLLEKRGHEGGNRGVGRPSWTARLLAALRSHRFDFFSFEWYPFDDVAGSPARQLAAAPGLLRGALARQGLPARFPALMTEYGYSAYAGPPEVDLPGALLNLDLVGSFLARGGSAAYLYGYPPSPLAQDRQGYWGALALFLPGGTRLPTYWAARMMSEDWCGLSVSGRRRKSGAFCALLQTVPPDRWLAAYAVRRPNQTVAVLLLNKDPRRSRAVRLAVDGRLVRSGALVRYGPAQYAWKADGPRGRPLRSLPPERSRFVGSLVLPPFSATVAVIATLRSVHRPSPAPPPGRQAPRNGPPTPGAPCPARPAATTRVSLAPRSSA